MLSVVKTFVVQSYQLHPQAVNSMTGMLAFTCGDIMSQQIATNESNKKVDYGKAIKTGFLGVLMNGLFLHHWYRGLDKAFGSSMKKNTRGIIFKMVADQIIYSPIAIAIFFGWVSSYSIENEGTDLVPITNKFNVENINRVVVKFKEKMDNFFLSTWATDCCFWPLINLVNFRYVPLNYRPTYVGIAQIAWQTFMSYISNQPKQT